MDKAKKAEELIKGIAIPSQVDVVFAINDELSRPNCNFGKVSELISSDVALTAKVLKIANSPFFSTRPIDNVEHALNLIGVANFTNVIMASALRDVMQSCCYADDHFWSHSMFTAKVASMIARKTKAMTESLGYLLGLFHDCAIPILLSKYPEYIQVFDHALRYSFESPEKEDALVQTDHSILGSMLTKSWRMPPVIYQTMGIHHDRVISGLDSETKKAAAVLLLAEYIAVAYTSEKFKLDNSHNWGDRYGETLEDLSIGQEELLDLIEDSFDVLDKTNPYMVGQKTR